MTGWVVGDPTTGATGLLNPPVGGHQWSSNAIPRPDQATQTVYDRVDRSPRAPSRAQQQPSPPHTAVGAAPSSGCEGAALPTGVLLPGAKGNAMNGNFRVNAPPNRQSHLHSRTMSIRYLTTGVGRAIRETGQALDRLGMRAQGDHSFKEKCKPVCAVASVYYLLIGGFPFRSLQAPPGNAPFRQAPLPSDRFVGSSQRRHHRGCSSWR
jgi:hypothetical protein